MPRRGCDNDESGDRGERREELPSMDASGLGRSGGLADFERIDTHWIGDVLELG
jgi:hypothetical protein